MTDGDVVAEILGRAIGEILPEHRASGTPMEHAQSTAKALLAAAANYRGAMADLSEIEEIVGPPLPNEGVVRAAMRCAKERDAARISADEWRERAEAADKGYGRSFEEELDTVRAERADAESLRPLVERLLRGSVPMAHGRCEVLTVDVDELRDALRAEQRLRELPARDER